MVDAPDMNGTLKATETNKAVDGNEGSGDGAPKLDAPAQGDSASKPATLQLLKPSEELEADSKAGSRDRSDAMKSPMARV